jgi:hypothetical protein
MSVVLHFLKEAWEAFRDVLPEELEREIAKAVPKDRAAMRAEKEAAARS